MPRDMLDTNMCAYLMENHPAEVARRFSRCYVGDVGNYACRTSIRRSGIG